MLTVELVVQPDLDPATSSGFDLHLLEQASGQAQRACLRVYTLAGDVLSLGRYHLAPAGDVDGRVLVHRRLGGGRVLPFGSGVALLSLTLPHRSALVADDPLALRPEQALNRWARALLGGLRQLGVEAFYPGRDCITVERRMLGLVSLETDLSGATVCEAALAIEGGWPRLGQLVAAVDRDAVLAAQLFSPEQVTTLAARGSAPSLDELARCVGDSLMRQFGVALAAGSAPNGLADAASRAAAWVGSRRLPPGLDRHAAEWGQLGVFEVYCAVRGGVIDDLVVAGDFIGDSPSIDRLERGLRGCAFAPAAVAAVVDAVYADPHSFLLGVGPLRTVVDTIVRAA